MKNRIEHIDQVDLLADPACANLNESRNNSYYKAQNSMIRDKRTITFLKILLSIYVFFY